MIVTKSFVYIHFFRSGGTFINELLARYMNGRFLGYHRPRRLLPPEYRHLPAIGNIRNPWDWYVSVYHHAVNFGYPRGAGTFMNMLVNYAKYDFKESIRRLIDVTWMTPRDIANAENHFPCSYDWSMKLTDNLTKQDCRNYLGFGKGFYSWLFEHMYAVGGSCETVQFCKAESLRADFKEMLSLYIGSLPDEIEQFLNKAPKLNAMSGMNSYLNVIPRPRDVDYRRYYDDQLASLVYERDREMIDRYGYTF
jgi:hypothetical protein